eukprot:1288314-Alexandrium_andersonii.AAC.1
MSVIPTLRLHHRPPPTLQRVWTPWDCTRHSASGSAGCRRNALPDDVPQQERVIHRLPALEPLHKLQWDWTQWDWICRRAS